MNIGSQKGTNDMNIPFIINQLLLQQDGEKAKHEERFYPFIPRHEKTCSLPLNPLNKNFQSHRFNYVKMRRSLYDHTKSLRHYDNTFSINTVIQPQSIKLPKHISSLKSKTSVKIRDQFKDILKKVDLIIPKKQKENKEIEGKNEKKRKILIKENKIIQKFTVDIPSVRAQTIVPCPRKRNHLSMVDAEITTDNTFSLIF
jgi:hypothetical protein